MRCVVGYEATPQGLDALNLGIDLAQSLDAELNIVLVLRRRDAFSHEYPPTGDVQDILLNQGFRWLKEALALVPAGVRACARIYSGASTADGLTRAAEELDADLLCVGGASSSPLKRHKLGSVATDLLFGSPVPVALAPRGYVRHPLSRITCAVGTRPGSGSLVETGLVTARRAQVPLRLLALLGVNHDEARESFAQENAQRVLDDARVTLGITNRTVPVAIEMGKSSEINNAVDTVEWRDGDLLCVGSSRVEQSRSVFAGSITMRILKHLTVPMVIVPRGYRARPDSGEGAAHE
ncbi:Universal stress protein family protein [Corynebacterium ciconiae DSM 44920]|uniref:universal stress protein n=1 Tax=Corynebacterium ciconiae TaxID=227319 RepID=UPI00037D3FFF|nr:universal stress protein [Corynebacterium ciconiae]WKD60346.1 Universal stress protein family protein [Corynebacterium ciconiae DSM 44920]